MPNPYIEIRTQQLPGLGRQAYLQSVVRKLQEGNHVSLVSPRYMGKSCFVRSLVRCPELRERFQGIGLCDVRHEPLRDNEAFFAYILKKLESDPGVSADWKEFAIPEGNVSAWTTLYDLGKGLKAEGCRMLVVLDGLDQLAFDPGVDEAAWNNLNSLIDTGGIQFVTASCEGLDRLCLDPQSRGSLFFQRFGDAVALSAVDEVELPGWLDCAPCGADAFDRAARTELLHETGGHPKLLSVLLSRLTDGATAAQVTAAAAQLVEDRAGDVLSVFEELSPDLREAISTLDEAGRTTREGRRALLARCLVREGRAGRLEQSCRMIGKLAEGSRPGESTMRDLFGSEETYFPNAAHVLRLRLSGVARNSPHEVFRLATKILENLEVPKDALMLLRRVEDEVFGLIDQVVGSPFPALLVQNPPRGFRNGDRAHNIRVVDCLTSDSAGYSNAKLPRSIYVLLSAIHSGGNYANHPQGQTLSPGFAHAMAITVMELAAEMKRSELIQETSPSDMPTLPTSAPSLY